MHRSRRHLRWIAPMALGLALGLAPRDARACGGLFCSAANPVNQAAERIVFAHDESAGEVTAVIEILYQGPAERFAWILPVAGSPAVSVSTNVLLNRLQQATNPTYQLQRSWPDCDANANGGPSSGFGGSSGGASPPSVDSGEDDGGGSVTVVASGNAGPYDYQVISVAAAQGADPAQDAVDWLEENEYDTGATGPDLLRPYLEGGMNLLAVRLSKQASVGSIRPIKITYDSNEPMIPIKPTAVAANDDMGILVWVLGSARSVPYNYRTLELNEALIDWFNPQQSYNDVVIAAANETGDGQGFVTEQARLTVDPQLGDISQVLFPEQYIITDYRNDADSFSDAELIAEVATRFSVFNAFAFTGPFGGAAPDVSGQVSLDGVADVLTRNLTLPEGVNVASLIRSPRCYFDEFVTAETFYCDGQIAPPERISLAMFNRTQFMQDVESLVIAPIEDTVRLFVDLPYMTRSYTTLSADEMTVDPAFVINSDLPDVSNQHSLPIAYEGCFGDISGEWEATIDGRLVRGEGTTWPLTLDNREEDMPVNLRVLQLGGSGLGQVYQDNNQIIEDLLASQFGMSGGDPGMGTAGSGGSAGDPMSPGGIRGSSGGCSVTAGRSTSAGSAAALLGLFALASLRRRRPA